jgi:hypothetical protein
LLFCLLLLVVTPQPTHNASHLLIQKSNVLQKPVEDEVVGVASLLLLF